jgi:hypothetical protein
MARHSVAPGDDERWPGVPSNVPIPDPSRLATEALLREITHLRELLQGRDDSLKHELDTYIESHHAKHGEFKNAFNARYDDMSNRIKELDRRYQQRYEGQTEAISAAFEAQQEATRTALTAAEKAVQTALESADKAVLKSETLNEKRFQLMNENTLIVSELSDRIERAQEKIEGVSHVTDAKFVTYRTLIDSQADKVALALAASDKAVSKAETANEKRFEGINEFRGQLGDLSNTLMPRSEANQLATSLSARMDASIKSIETSLTDLKSRLDRQEGKSGGYSAGAGALVAGIGVIATLITIVTAIILVVN